MYVELDIALQRRRGKEVRYGVCARQAPTGAAEPPRGRCPWRPACHKTPPARPAHRHQLKLPVSARLAAIAGAVVPPRRMHEAVGSGEGRVRRARDARGKGVVPYVLHSSRPLSPHQTLANGATLARRCAPCMHTPEAPQSAPVPGDPLVRRCRVAACSPCNAEASLRLETRSW